MGMNDIIFTIKVNARDFNKVMNMSMEKFREQNAQMVTITGTGAKLANGIRKITHGLKGFRMEMLSVMFFGMGMASALSGLLNPSLQMVGVFDLLNTTLGVTFLPTALMILDWVVALMDIMTGLPEPVQAVIGGFVLFGIVLGKLLFIIGSLTLGLGGLSMAWGTLTAIVGAIFSPITFIIGAIIGLIALWKNWEKVSVGVKIALVALSVVLGTIAVALGFFFGWVLLIIGAIIGVMAVIKNWGAIVDWLKEKWIGIKTFFSDLFQGIGNFIDTFIVRPFEVAMDFIKGMLNKLIRVYNKIAGFVGLPNIPEFDLGSRQFGGFIPQDGLYRLHAGETVTPASNSSFNFAPNFNINTTGGVDIQTIKNEMNNLFARELASIARR